MLHYHPDWGRAAAILNYFLPLQLKARASRRAGSHSVCPKKEKTGVLSKIANHFSTDHFPDGRTRTHTHTLLCVCVCVCVCADMYVCVVHTKHGAVVKLIIS